MTESSNSSTGTAPQTAPPAADLPRHLVSLPGERWALWRWFCLRGAGFPARDVLRLAAPDSARAADRVEAAEEAAEARRQEALAHLRDGLEEVEKKERFRRTDAIGRLNKGRLPKRRDAQGPVFDAYGAALEEVAEARQAFEETFDREVVDLGRELREVAGDDRFRKAVAWQNRHVLETGLDVLLRSAVDGSRNSRERQHEQAVTAYLQRYTTKNDTIGWFGPMGWGRFREDGDALRLEPGDRLVEESFVHFENWCVDEVAKVLLEDEAVRPWLPPRTLPFFFLKGNLYIPLKGDPVELDAEDLALLRACEGRRTAASLAEDMAADPALSFADSASVLERIGAMAERGIVAWRPELPLVRRPERSLRRLVEGIGDPELRAPRLARVEELEDHRDAIAAAAAEGASSQQLVEALEALEEWFTELTGRGSTRLQGKPYAGRTLIHEDCRRDLVLEMGPDLLEAVGPALSLVLMSARWFTWELSRRWTEQLNDAYRELREETGEVVIPLFQFFQRIRPILLNANVDVVSRVAGEMQEVWAGLLDLDGGERRVERSSDSLRQRLEEAFAAPGPGWKHAREQCPDLMIAAESEEALRRGDFHFVLGEIHLATNTLRTRLFSESHPDPSQLEQAITWDIPEPTVVPWLPRLQHEQELVDLVGIHLAPTSGRLDFGLVGEKDLRVSVNTEPPADPEVETARIGSFVVLERDGDLRVQSLDGRHDFAVMDFLDVAFSAQTINSFRVLPRRRHVPRVTVDRLVVQRETWRLPAKELEFADASTEAERFLEARRWARRLGVPRFTFGRSPYENKPFFLDFDSPPALETFCRIVRRAREKGGDDVLVGVSEMLPGVDQTWLRDAEGRTYTSELRVVAVDLAAGGANALHPHMAATTGEDA